MTAQQQLERLLAIFSWSFRLRRKIVFEYLIATTSEKTLVTKFSGLDNKADYV